MKLCQNCCQPVAEESTTCPACGSEVGEGRKFIDDYRIAEVLHESHSSTRCRAFKDGVEEPFMIRIFTPDSGVDDKVADRLKRELEELKRLPESYFVRHHEIKRSSDRLWYRVSEWVNAETWGALLSSGRLQDYRVAFDLFYRIASILEGLHQIGHIIPHLILNDILVFKGEQDALEVKIDYKLSRFLAPHIDRPGPMLKNLLTYHPDIINQRPLDIRSDIWSLGKIFVELLTGDPEVSDFSTKVDELPLPQEVASLIKVMLAEDPNLRPRSMSEVALSLSRVNDKDIEAAKLSRIESAHAPVKDVKGIKKRLTLLAIAVAALALIGVLTWHYFGFEKKDKEAILIGFANQYANSLAFVVVDYWLEEGETILYRQRTEGTAFLVDEEGYLLTNRHVACPWLTDNGLLFAINNLKQQMRSPGLRYRIFLWFEGEKAFNRLPDLSNSPDLEDIYFLDPAFRTDGVPRLTISGVAKTPIKTWSLVKSPLKDDFAVLKIDKVPEGLKPLPLDSEIDVRKIPKLSPVITLGFPLGSRTQGTTVNVSVTLGHVRRTFENMFQVDTSIHSGNSGGPIIDIRGKAIGIATGVIIGRAIGPLPVATPLSDIGLVQPVNKVAAFVKELKAGHVKWNGVLDLSVDAKLKQITETARRGRWADAQALADKELRLSLDPTLVMAAGMMHFCAGDNQGAERLFSQALSMDEENNKARLMLYIIDWLADQTRDSPHRRELLALDWRSPDEFSGYLVRVLEAMVDEKSALKGWYTESEKSWLHYVAGLIRAKQGDRSGSEELLKEAVLKAGIDDWIFFLALARLEMVHKQRISSLRNKAEIEHYKAEMESFAQKIQKVYTTKEERQTSFSSLMAGLKQESVSLEEKRGILEQILERNYLTGVALVGLVYYSAMDEAWDQALGYARTFLDIDGRENADRLSVGLMEAEIIYNMGEKVKARAGLEDYYRRTEDPWYRAITEYLLGERTEQSLTEEAGESPENLITAHTALGFWAEGSGDRKKALKHYKEALGSYMDNRIEYEFIRERIKRLKRRSE